VITQLKIVGVFLSHVRLWIQNYKVDRIFRLESRLHSIDPSIHHDREHIEDKKYDDEKTIMVPSKEKEERINMCQR
jgi:hypothetical protein